MTDQGTIWLTQEAYDKLQAELDDLKGPKRQEIIEKIAAARDEGDLKENSGYHAAQGRPGQAGGPDPPARGHAAARRGRRDPSRRRCRRARHGRHRRLRRRRHREVPPRRPREPRRGRHPRRLLARSRRWAPRSTASPRATRSSYTAPNGKELSVDDRRRGALQGLSIGRCHSSERCASHIPDAREVGGAPLRRISGHVPWRAVAEPQGRCPECGWDTAHRRTPAQSARR